MKTYSAIGSVLGNTLGGGTGFYTSQTLKDFDSMDDLINKAKEMLKNGSLDSGFGFESLEGALLRIKEEDKIIVDNKEYIHDDYTYKTIGNISDDEFDEALLFLDS